MAQIKSEIDIEKFTIKKEGNFIASNFHMLMRQYSLALSEAKRFFIEREEKARELKKWQGRWKLLFKNKDLEIAKVRNRTDMLEIELAGKLYVLEYFEKCRLKLIELNGGAAPTNEQYQAEQPEYYKWFLEQKIIQQLNQRNTGVDQGVFNAIDMLRETPVLNEKYQISIVVPQTPEKTIEMAKDLFINRLISNRYGITADELTKIAEIEKSKSQGKTDES